MPATTDDHWIYTINEWTREPFTQILDALPKTIKAIHDIGANVGGFTHVIHEKYPKAIIYAFEPVAANFDALFTNVHEYAVPIPRGIYYGATQSRVTSRGDSNIGAFFLEQINAGEPRVFHNEVIELRPLEDYPTADLIKLDVEGAEENIIEHSTVLKTTPLIIVEWHPDHVNPIEFFSKHLPNHKIVVNLENKQFLLCLK